MSFMPWVNMKAVARERARPIQPAFNSHIFRFHTSDFGVDLLTVGPGTKKRQTMKTAPAGTTKAMTIRSHVGMVSFASYGYDMERSTKENGRWKGVMPFQAAPTAAMAAMAIQSNIYEAINRFDGIIEFMVFISADRAVALNNCALDRDESNRRCLEDQYQDDAVDAASGGK
jgi:hypothetical protein